MNHLISAIFPVKNRPCAAYAAHGVLHRTQIGVGNSRNLLHTLQKGASNPAGAVPNRHIGPSRGTFGGGCRFGGMAMPASEVPGW